MRYTKFAATSALAIAALGISAGTAYADPAAAADPGIHWDTKIDGASVVLKTDAGSLTTQDGQFQVRDNNGGLVTQFPLNIITGDVAHPVAA
ncbi:hypothetical protein ACWEKS_36815, partial [Nocardia sp. NPDC004711]